MFNNPSMWLKRKNPRLTISDGSVHGTIQIIQVDGQTCHTNLAPILIENIGLGGACFQSELKLPKKSNYVIQLEFFLHEKPIRINAVIRWRLEIPQSEMFRYGCEYIRDGLTQREWTQIFQCYVLLEEKKRTPLLERYQKSIKTEEVRNVTVNSVNSY